jgi:ribonuclease R
MTRNKRRGLYRVHEGPTPDKLKALRDYLRNLGLSLDGGDDPSTEDYARLIKAARNRPDFEIIQTMCLRSLQQAIYSPEQVGHFGLSYDHYAHFTSPIRRYPDLLTHRVIKSVLRGKRYVPEVDDQGGAPALTRDEYEHAVWEKLGVLLSARERRADDASRDVEAWLKCYFIKDKLGEEFTGVVSGVTTFGIFVQLDALYVEGLVHITELGTDFFQYDDARHELRGERTGKRYQLTDRVTVKVAKVDLEARKIDLVLAGGVADQVSGVGQPKSAAAKALEAKPAKSRKPSANTESRYELDTSVDNGAPSKRSKGGSAAKAKPATKTSKKKR